MVEAIGTPIKEGMFVSGNTHVDGASGNADLSIPISGPKGKATIYAAATKFAGKWTYDKLVVQPASGDQIDLLIDLSGVNPIRGWWESIAHRL